MQPVILKYGPDRVSPAWDSVTAVWHVFLILANPFHSMTARQVKLCLCVAPTCVLTWGEWTATARRKALFPSRQYCFLTCSETVAKDSSCSHCLSIPAMFSTQCFPCGIPRDLPLST